MGLFDIIDDAVSYVADEVSDFIERPVSKTIEHVTRPLVDTIDVIDGLTEGELRHKAVLRLGAEVASGMAIGELVDWYSDLN